MLGIHIQKDMYAHINKYSFTLQTTALLINEQV